jgi:hypothetical protein
METMGKETVAEWEATSCSHAPILGVLEGPMMELVARSETVVFTSAVAKVGRTIVWSFL